MTDFRKPADTSLPPPAVFHYDEQPYGRVTLTNCRWGTANGYTTLMGTVESGVQATALICGVTMSTRDQKSTSRTVYGIMQYEIDQGHCHRAYCG